MDTVRMFESLPAFEKERRRGKKQAGDSPAFFFN
jgi:hypothetical protein